MRIRNLVSLMLMSAAAAGAQTTPDLKQVLDRLERLEQDNRTLLQEVRALREELKASRPVERLDTQEARIEEQAQTKVEASRKMPLRITGMALFNSYINGRYNNGSENPTLASATAFQRTGGGTFRQSVIGLEFFGPETASGAKVSGTLFMDFFGGSAQNLNNLMRIRTGHVSVDWTCARIRLVSPNRIEDHLTRQRPVGVL